MSPIDITKKFNDAINSQSLSSLGALMTNDHTFVDSAGNTVVGKGKSLASWRDFFEKYKDYKNYFEQITENQGVVTAKGKSTCLIDELNGPATWTVTVRDGKVAKWEVH